MRLAEINSEVITVEQFADALQIGRRQAYALVNSGAIYSARIGRSIRIPKAAVVRFLDGEKNDLEGSQLKVVTGGGRGHPNSG